MATNNVNQAPDCDEHLDLHDAYQMAQGVGFEHDLNLKNQNVKDLAARLNGISCITAVLMTDELDVDLGGFIRGGLVGAVHALANDCTRALEEIDMRQKKERQAA
ncbi:MAG: hypothetical protein V4794_19530 [Pseudomonadota bacterium]